MERYLLVLQIINYYLFILLSQIIRNNVPKINVWPYIYKEWPYIFRILIPGHAIYTYFSIFSTQHS